MTKFSVDGLLALTVEEIKIVYLRCYGETVEETARLLNLAPATIYSRIPKIAELLGLENWKEIEAELRIPILRIIPNTKALDDGWPEAFREKIESLREPKAPLETPPVSKTEPVGTNRASSTPNTPPSKSTLNQTGAGTPGNRRTPWILIAVPLLIAGVLCIASLIWGGSFLAPFFRRTPLSPAASETTVPLVEITASPQPSTTPAIQITDTANLFPTNTIESTSTSTPTATLAQTITPIPTDTKSPLDLRVGDVLEDARVSLRLVKVGYNEGYDRIGARRAPISYYFDFTNHSGETIVLQFDQYDFESTDDIGQTVNCLFYHISGAGPAVNEPLANGATRQIVARCGDGQLNPAVNSFTLTVHPFSTLPESKWIVEIPR